MKCQPFLEAWACSQKSCKKPLVLICFLMWCQLLLTHLLILFQLPKLLGRWSLCNRWAPSSHCSSWSTCRWINGTWNVPDFPCHRWLFFSQLGFPRQHHHASAQRRRPAVSSVLLGYNFGEGKVTNKIMFSLKHYTILGKIFEFWG